MRETLFFYCQHSRGIGHLTRSFALACALRERFRVVFLNGGRLPDGIEVPQGVECIDLPPPGMDDSHTVVSRDAGIDVQAARAERRRLIDGAVRTAELLSQLVARQVQQEPVLEEPARLRAPV
jgi:predicted glycosyltransferase